MTVRAFDACEINTQAHIRQMRQTEQPIKHFTVCFFFHSFSLGFSTHVRLARHCERKRDRVRDAERLERVDQQNVPIS